VIEVLIEVANGAPSVYMHRDRLALVIPVVIMGMVGGLELVRGAKREGARMCATASDGIETKRCCFSAAASARRVACYAFSCPRSLRLRGHPPPQAPPSPPGPACRHWGIIDNSKSEA